MFSFHGISVGVSDTMRSFCFSSFYLIIYFFLLFFLFCGASSEFSCLDTIFGGEYLIFYGFSVYLWCVLTKLITCIILFGFVDIDCTSPNSSCLLSFEILGLFKLTSSSFFGQIPCSLRLFDLSYFVYLLHRLSRFLLNTS